MGEPAGSVQRMANALNEVIRDRDSLRAENKRLRQEAFDRSSCPNGPDEDGGWPCDPQVTYGGGWAVCSVCGRGGSWPASEHNQDSVPKAGA